MKNKKADLPAKPKEKKHDFFKRITEPESFRKDLLEASKSTLSTLRDIYAVKQLRDAKAEVIKTIQEEMRIIKLLSQKVEYLMPQYSKDDLKRYAPEPKQEPIAIKEEPEEKHEKISDNEIDKLSRSLKDIQRRINGLPPLEEKEKHFTPITSKKRESTNDLGDALANIQKKLNNL